MRTLAYDAGQRPGETKKRDVQESEAKYWGTLGKHRTFTRTDGSVGKDKTRGWHSRPGQKQTIRNANRAITKRARQILKKQMLSDISG